jgi:hypothetical protein
MLMLNSLVGFGAGGGGPLGSTALRTTLYDQVTADASPWTYSGGYGDQFKTDTIGSTSTNETYNASKYYWPVGSSTTVATTVTADNVFGAWIGRTVVDRTYTIPNSVTVTSIHVYSTVAAGSIPVKILQRNSAGNYTVCKAQTVSHGGGGWQEFTLSSSYSVPASGDFYVGAYASSGYSMANGPSGNFAWSSGDASGTVTMTEVGSGAAQVPITKATYTGTTPNMTLLPSAQSAATASNAEIAVLYLAVDSSTLNTDFTVEVSANGGTNYTTVSVSDIANDVSGYKCLYGTATGMTAGTSFLYRVKTLNNKQQKVRGVFWRPY